MSTTNAKPMTKPKVMAALAQATGLSKKQVSGFFEEIGNLIGFDGRSHRSAIRFAERRLPQKLRN